MENEQQKDLLSATEPNKAEPAKPVRGVSGAGKFGDCLLGVLISIVGADIFGFLWLVAQNLMDPYYVDWSELGSDFGSNTFYGINWGGLLPVAVIALFGLFSKNRWKYVFRGMLILPLGVLIFFLLAFGACIIIMSQWRT